jgi:plasmid stabilization system protein ParE
MAALGMVRWSPAAADDLEDALAYAATQGPGQAARLSAAVSEALVRLQAFPALGKPGRVSGTREHLLGELPYFLPYTVEGNGLTILGIMHTVRRWPERRQGTGR